MKECKNCGAKIDDLYCSTCGQKDINILETKEFFKDFFSDVLDFDSRFYKSLKYLIFNPGFLTTEYWLGKKNKYIPPIKLILITSFIYFIILPYVLDTSETFFDNTDFSQEKLDLMNTRLALAELFIEKYLVVLFSPLIALLFKVLYKTKRLFYIHHIIGLLHWCSFDFIVATFFSSISYFFSQYADIFDYLSISLTFGYLFLMMKNIYNESLLKTITKFFVVLLFIILIISLLITLFFLINSF